MRNDLAAAIYFQTGGCNPGGYLVWLPTVNYADGSGFKISTDWAHPRSRDAWFRKRAKSENE